VIVDIGTPLKTIDLGRAEKKDIDAIVHDIIAEKRSFYEKKYPAYKRAET
jgi:hypothetical protein